MRYVIKKKAVTSLKNAGWIDCTRGSSSPATTIKVILNHKQGKPHELYSAEVYLECVLQPLYFPDNDSDISVLQFGHSANTVMQGGIN